MSEKKAADKATDTAVKTKKQAAEKVETVIYIGPNKLMAGLKSYTVYRGRPDELIESVAGKYKNIARLFVPVEGLNDAMAAVKKKGTPVNLAYNEMMGANE